MKRNILITLLIITALSPLIAQYAPGVDWKQIETDHFQMIFPQELEQDARRAALIAEEYYTHNTFEGTKHPYRRWPLVLTNRSTQANGFVDPMNQRTVWYGTPIGESLGTQEWYKTLAVHEGRHIAQTERYKRGFLQLAYLFSGNAPIALGGGLVNPGWFAEGDAVDRETMFTDGGRGRNTLFHREMEAIILEEDGFNYQKVKNGSFSDNIPNHYNLGYPLVAYTRSQYGEDRWDRFMAGATWLPLPILGPTVGSIYATGHSPHKIYNEMVSHWAEERRLQMENEVYTDIEVFSDENDIYSTYDSLTSLSDGSILARRHSMSSPSALVRIDDEGEEVIRRISGYDLLALGENLIVNIETIADLRYSSMSSSDIFVTDINSGKSRRLTANGRYQGLALNRQETRIAALEIGFDRSWSLSLIDLASGEEIRRISLPKGVSASAPKFNSDGSRLVLLLRGIKGLGLAEIDLNNPAGELSMVLPFSNELIRRPSYAGDGIMFSSNYSGREAIYMISSDGERQLMAQRPYTAVEPIASFDGNGFYYLDYNGMKGERIVKASYPVPGSLELPENRLGQTIVASFGLEEGQAPFSLEVEPSAEAMAALEVREYYPAANLFRVVGWSPIINGGETVEPVDAKGISGLSISSIGLSLTSQDVLGTLGMQLQGTYFLNEKTFGGMFNAVLSSLYPVISFNGSYTYRKPEGSEFHEALYGLNIGLPLNLSRGEWYTSLNINAGFSGRYKKVVTEPVGEHSFPLSYGVNFSHLLGGSMRSLAPVLGIDLQTNAVHTPFGGVNEYLLSGILTGYLPGIFNNNTIKLNAGWERQNSDYSSYLHGAKGYDVLSGEDLIHLEAEYLFPIFYPDFTIGPFAYLKRLRGDFYGQLTRRDGENFSSAGFQIDLDFTVADLPVLFSVGFRAGYLIESGKMKYDFVFMGQ